MTPRNQVQAHEDGHGVQMLQVVQATIHFVPSSSVVLHLVDYL